MYNVDFFGMLHKADPEPDPGALEKAGSIPKFIA